jgi:deoxyribodipyrimidine photo-lyase
VQAECGVTVGRDYPAPIVEHKLQREKALQLYKEASANKGGLHSLEAAI